MSRCERMPIIVGDSSITPEVGQQADTLALRPESTVHRNAATESLGTFLEKRYATFTAGIERSCVTQAAPFGDVATYLNNWTTKNFSLSNQGLDVQAEVKAFVDDTRAEPYRQSQHQLDEPYLLASARKCVATLRHQAESFGATFDAEHFKSDMERAVATALKPYQKEFSWILKENGPFKMSGKDYYRLVRVENLAKDWLPADNDLRKEIGRILDIAQKHGRYRP